MSAPGSEELAQALPIEVGLHRRVAARLAWALHVATAAFLLTGWALPWVPAWWLYALGAPLIQLGWLAFNDHCWLSIIEARLRGESLVIVQEDGDEEARVFVGELIESIIKRPVPRQVSNYISYSVLWGGFIVSVWRIHHAS